MIVPLFIAVLGIFVAVSGAKDLPIVGVRSGVNPQTGQVPARRNINSIYEEAGPQWDLYIGALTAMQDANETDPSSFFQVAGIHGHPFIAWSGGGPQSGSEAGYCPHNQIQFGCWHRAYLSLYEQILVRHAVHIAEGYPETSRRRYVEAAESLRLGYWEWASDSNVPLATVPETVVINKPVGGVVQPVSVRNPLSSYRYPESALRGDFGSFAGRNRTRRCVDTGESYPQTANEMLSEFNLKEKVYNVFLRAKSFDEMVSTQLRGPNFEGPHNEVHVGAACGQDLLFLSISAFEPLFWLHHANVDRLIAYWQALRFENATMHFSYPSDQMFATPAGTIVTPQSPIYPFMNPEGQALTCESMTHVREWGYTYEPMSFWDQAPGETKMAVSRAVNNLYGPQPPANSSEWSSRRLKTVARTEYFAKVEVERSELELPCQMQLYIKGKQVGAFTVLGMPSRGMSYEEIPLKRGIETLGMSGFERKGVLEAVGAELEVVISKLDGTTMPLDKVPSLKIELEDIEVIPSSSPDEMPSLGERHSRKAAARPLVR